MTFAHVGRCFPNDDPQSGGKKSAIYRLMCILLLFYGREWLNATKRLPLKSTSNINTKFHKHFQML